MGRTSVFTPRSRRGAKGERRRREQRDVSVGGGAAKAGKGGEQDTFAAAQRTDGIEKDNLHPVEGAAPARSRR